MNYVKELSTGDFFEVPLEYTGIEGTGIIRNIETDYGWCPVLFQENLLVVGADDKVVGKVGTPMDEYFEAREVGEEVTTVNCVLSPLITAVVKRFVSGSDDTILECTPNGDIELECATDYEGITRVSGTITAVTYHAITLNSNGNYEIRITKTNDGDELVILRQPTCTGAFWGGIDYYYSALTPSTGGGGGLIDATKFTYNTETASLDTLVYTGFDEVAVPTGFRSIAGYNVPPQGDTLSATGGVYRPLTIGYDTYNRVESLGITRYNPRARYLFNHLAPLMVQAANQMINHINGGAFPTEYPSGYNNSGAWGDLEKVRDHEDYSGLTNIGAEKLGDYVFQQRDWSLDPISGEELRASQSFFMIDEEQLNTGLGGIGYYEFLGRITKGIRVAADRTNGSNDIDIAYYGVAYNSFWYTYNDRDTITDSIMETHLLTGTNALLTTTMKNTGCWFDTAHYTSCPWITSHDMYERNVDGTFKLVSGERVFAKVDFAETIYGEETLFRAEPEDDMKYWMINNSGNSALGIGVKEQRRGSQYFTNLGTESCGIKQEYLDQGWTEFELGLPRPSMWTPITKQCKDQPYHITDTILINLLLARRAETGTNDLSYYSSSLKIKPYAELRFLCEGKKGGNTLSDTQKGKELYCFETLMAYLSGCLGVSVEGEGRITGLNDEVYQPMNLHGQIHALQARNQLFKDLAGYDPEDFLYLHFYYPSAVNQRHGAFGFAIYVGTKICFIFADPNLNYDETNDLTLNIDGTDHTIRVNGKDLYIYNTISGLPSGLTKNDFYLDYNTIYGEHIRLSGNFTGDLNDTFLIGL